MTLTKKPMVRDAAMMVAVCGGLLCVALLSGSERISLGHDHGGVPRMRLVQHAPLISRQGQPATPTKDATLILRYGGGTPADSGRLGYCTAVFGGDGRVKIISRRNDKRDLQPLPGDIVVYENDALSPELVQAIFAAAEAALKEKPYRGTTHDGSFLRLECHDAVAAKIDHGNMPEFWNAPPGMLKLVALMNGLLPSQSRVPLRPKPSAEWSIVLRLMHRNGNQASRTTLEARISSYGPATITAGDRKLYENDVLPAEDFDLLNRIAQQACREAEVDRGKGAGLEVSLEILRNGTVTMEHHDRGLGSFSEASTESKRVIRWVNDHLPKADRIDLGNISDRPKP